MPELHPYDVIRRPIVSEKTNLLVSDLKQFTFEVAGNANKFQIAEAVGLLFKSKRKMFSKFVQWSCLPSWVVVDVKATSATASGRRPLLPWAVAQPSTSLMSKGANHAD